MTKRKTPKKRPLIVRLLLYFVAAVLVCVILLFAVNLGMVLSVRGQMTDYADAVCMTDVDCVIVLGCKVYNDGTPSAMLRDRLLTAITLMQNGVTDRMLVSGDHGREAYDEVNAMKDFAIEKGIPSEKIFMDHAGFSTYETLYRARDVFQAKRVIIVTQTYHLYRALYVARSLGIEAYGVSADLDRYAGQTYRDCRELLARVKDFGYCVLKPAPTYLGDPIPISGNGDDTNDRERKTDTGTDEKNASERADFSSDALAIKRKVLYNDRV